MNLTGHNGVNYSPAPERCILHPVLLILVVSTNISADEGVACVSKRFMKIILLEDCVIA